MGRCRTGCRPRKFSAMSTVAASAIVGFLGNRLIQGLGKCSVVGDSRPPSMSMLSTYQNKVIHLSCKHVIDVAFL